MGRGPSYPYVGLEEAVGLARKVYDYAKRGPAPVDSVVKEAWNYSATSSSGVKVLAALRAFGLVEDMPGTNGKSLRLSNRAIRILLDDSSSAARKEEIRKAALSPKWYEYCWKHWGKDMPASMRSNLLIEHGFVDTTVDGFLRDYRRTMAFAGILDGSTDSKSSESEKESGAGDPVQSELQGVLRGETAVIPSNEPLPPRTPDGVVVPTPGLPQTKADPPLAPHGGATMLQETFSLPDGTSVTIQWPAAFTPEAFEDFSDWLNIVKRKISRTVKQAESERNIGGKEGESTTQPPTPGFQTEVR